jgi:hypothetical protein
MGGLDMDRGVVTGTLDVEANISHEVDVDHPLDDVPTVVAALKAVVPAAREDRLKWELRPGLERGPVRTGRSGPSIIADLHDDVGDDVLGRRYAFVEMNGSLAVSAPRSSCSLPWVRTVAFVNNVASPSMSTRSSSSARRSMLRTLSRAEDSLRTAG